MVANKAGRLSSAFSDALSIAHDILKSDCTKGNFLYNRFKSVCVSYQGISLPIYRTPTNDTSLYDSLDSEIIKNYLKLTLASLIFNIMKDERLLWSTRLRTLR
uniref:Uncharacterized protein n=1 Tax=Glossina austeni TaxID=7395 RepID=A0A1A9VYJ1_GLOAU